VVQGCSHPTTAGAGFDAVEAAAIIARLAIGTLRLPGGYPDADFDYAAISFRRAIDDPEFPRFATSSLPVIQGCEQCQVAAGLALQP
jgi:hypothetical protein